MKRKKSSPALVLFKNEKNEQGNRQACVYAVCEVSGVKAGPVWSHSAAAIKRVLATLTEKCDCPATYHKAIS